MSDEDRKVPPQASDMMAAVRLGLDAERAKMMEDRLEIANEKLALHDAKMVAKPAWWSDWLKPAPILWAIGAAALGWNSYQSSQGGISKTLDSINNTIARFGERLDHDEQATAERVRDYIPIIQANKAALDLSAQMNKSQDERMSNLAKAMEDQRLSVERLKDVIQQTHEEMMIDRAKHEKETRLMQQDRVTGAARVR